MTRIVLVTGGSSGIGRAVAERFVNAGDDVVITGRRTDALAEAAAATGARPIRCDATKPADIAALVKQLGDRVDVVVNMAGGNTDFEQRVGDDASLEEIAAAWRTNLDANLLSTVLTTTGLLPAIPAGGSIINVSSIGAEYASTSYGAAKAAVAAWTAGLSAQTAPRGVTHAAGFSDVIYGTSTWTFATPRERSWWSALWAERCTSSSFAQQAVHSGITTAPELLSVANGWREWARNPDAVFVVLHGEVLARC